MRRITIPVTTLVAAIGLAAATAAPATAMEPPGQPARQRFGCPDPVSGHPGAAGRRPGSSMSPLASPR
ncbi:hypothetical protein BH23ACT3_BH23ACT3_23240 [soil metagenome]